MRQEGAAYLFGNPGTTELPVVDGCHHHPDIQYILCLHENVAMATAMGYAAMTGNVGVVNVHVAPGLANAMGNLFNAWRCKLPLVVTAGQQDSDYLIEEPLLWADLVSMARPLTKWSCEVRSISELPMALHRAVKTALAPPAGPVFLSLPRDVMLEECPPRDGWTQSDPAAHSRKPGRSFAPTAEEGALRELADLMANAANPLLVAGDGISRAGAWDEAIALAEAAGLAVHNEPLPTHINFPSEHPLYLGPLESHRASFDRAFAGRDLLLFVGVSNHAPFGVYDGAPVLSPDLPIVYIGDDPWELAKNTPGRLAVLGGIRPTLAALLRLVRSQWTPEQKARAAARATAVAQRSAEYRRQLFAPLAGPAAASAEGRLSAEGELPARDPAGERLSVRRLLYELREVLPPDVVVANESVSSSPLVQSHLRYQQPLSYLASKAGGLGYAPGMAIGAKLGAPERPVLSIVGDGAFLYNPQVIWTAAHHQIPVTFLVLNNNEYRILKLNMARMGDRITSPRRARWPHLDLMDPAVSFEALAAAFGVPYFPLRSYEDIKEVIPAALRAPGPVLVEAVVEREGDPKPQTGGGRR